MHRIRRLTLAAAALAVAACDTTPIDPGVEEPFDAQAVLTDYEVMGAAIEDTDWSGLAALEGRMPFGGGPAPAVVRALAETEVQGGPHAYVAALARTLTRGPVTAAASGPMAGPLISGWNRGTTFVYNPATDDYEADLDRTDAPETGVRFVLYEVDDAGVPIVGEEAGFADLIDEGDDSVEDLALRLRVTWHETVILDYATTLDRVAGGGALTVTGFLQGEEARLDFDIGVDALDTPEGTRLDIGFDIGVAARDFRIVGDFSGLEGEDDGDGDVRLTVSHRDGSFRIEMTGTDGMLDGTIHVNGELFATVSGPDDAPVFLDADGAPLTWDQVLVLHRIVDVTEDVFDLLEDLVDPVDELLLLGFIL